LNSVLLGLREKAPHAGNIGWTLHREVGHMHEEPHEEMKAQIDARDVDTPLPNGRRSLPRGSHTNSLQ
jgi:hypothetical protein